VAVETLGIKLLPLAVRSSDEFDGAFAAMIRERPDAFLMTADPFHQLSIGRIIDFLANNRLPGMFLTREIVVAGGFMSYGASAVPYTCIRFCKAPSRRTCRSSSRSNSS
jgi:putative tryptophan/tyrosine transport system substrate-binding protein